MTEQRFHSEFGFSILLPSNWSEYELEDENNTNGFFDILDWTGNLRITALNIRVDRPDEFVRSNLNDKRSTVVIWDKIKVYYYSESSSDLYIYYWYLIENLKIYICSFTIDKENKLTDKNQRELVKVEGVLKTLKTE